MSKIKIYIEERIDVRGVKMYFVMKGVEVLGASLELDEAVRWYEAALSGYPKRKILNSKTVTI